MGLYPRFLNDTDNKTTRSNLSSTNPDVVNAEVIVCPCPKDPSNDVVCRAIWVTVWVGSFTPQPAWECPRKSIEFDVWVSL